MNRLVLLALLLLLMSKTSAQTLPANSADYAADWKRAEAAMVAGLPKSALTIANEIYLRAKAAQNYPQLVKATMRRTVYRSFREEDAYPDVIRGLRADIADAPEPARAVMQSVLGDLYFQYFAQHRYELMNRSRIEKPDPTPADSAKTPIDPDDLRTWDAARLLTTATAAYDASLTDRASLQQTPLAAYDAVLEKGDADGRLLRPTLFDLLAHRALAFYQNTEADILRPTFRFEIDRAAFLATPDVFARLPVQTQDTASLRARALRLYQELVSFHLNDKDLRPLTDTDVLRLAFVRQYSTVPGKDSLYRQTLTTLAERYQTQAGGDTYGLALAQWLLTVAEQYKPLTGTPDRDQPGKPAPVGKWERKQAVELARQLATRWPATRAGRGAALLVAEQTKPALTGKAEEINAPGLPFRLQAEYRNLPAVYVRVLQLPSGETLTMPDGSSDDLPKRRAAWLQRLLARPERHRARFALPDDGDLHTHSTELPLPALPAGRYAVLFSPTETITTATDLLTVTPVQVSALGYFTGNEPGNSRQIPTLFVLNRQSGQPMANVPVEFRYRVNPYQTPTAPEKIIRQPTDEQGRVRVKEMRLVPDNISFHFRLLAPGDTLDTETNYLYGGRYTPPTDEQPRLRQLLFTDRAIYRPGQPIYFKGVLYGGSQNDFATQANMLVQVFLYDANHEQVSDISLTTNEFGTFDGTFTAPVGRLTGRMTIGTLFGYGNEKEIRVEEYKRPTFAVTADTLKTAVRLEQSVMVSATAKTFAGAVVDGASVRYRVVRSYVQPWVWGGWYRRGSYGRPAPASLPAEIASGSLTTNATGTVSLTFTAEPDRSIDRVLNPFFTYDITFDVTDRAGETRSVTESLRIGYAGLIAELPIPPTLDKADPASFRVRAVNATGQTIPATGQVTVWRLLAPVRLLRARLWAQPDRQFLSRDDYEKQFPNDLFANENNPANWAKSIQVQQISVGNRTTATPTNFTLNTAPLEPGEYGADLTLTDPVTNETVTERRFFSLTDAAKRVALPRTDTWFQAKQTTVELSKAIPTGEAVFLLGNAQPGYILMSVERGHKFSQQTWLPTDGTLRRVTLPVTEADRGGFTVFFTMVQNGRIYTEQASVAVPFTNKNLTVETLTFRDKLRPGQPEQWTLRVSGPSQDKVLAEMVATLYDASLDAFVPHGWPVSIYSDYDTRFGGWNSQGFGLSNGLRPFFRYESGGGVPGLIYPELSWGPYSYSGDSGQLFYEATPGGRGEGRLQRRSVTGAVTMAAPMAMRARKVAGVSVSEADEAVAQDQDKEKSANEPAAPKPADNPPAPRTNFAETAFFFPKLQTDAEGRVLLTFTLPDALTRWRLLAFAHTHTMQTGSLVREVVAQKELMLTASTPRFLREGDTVRLAARINNLTDRPLSGTATLALTDALTSLAVDNQFKNTTVKVPFTIPAGQSSPVSWTVIVPTGAAETVSYRMLATAGAFTDGEERPLPVLPNRMLVLDAQPFWINGSGTKTVRLEPLAKLSPTAPGPQHERLTVEVTSNPAWYALQTLPYILEYPYDCTEQLASRLCANALAGYVVNSRPAFRTVIEAWSKQPPVTPLAKNAELKAVALTETPWLAEAKTQAAQQARLGQLFDQNRMTNDIRQTLDKLKTRQQANGGFVWFSGMRPDPTITLQVLTTFGHLAKLGATLPADLPPMLQRATQFVDAEMSAWVREDKKNKNPSRSSYWAGQYLYARSFFPQFPMTDKAAVAYVQDILSKHWLDQSLPGQAMAALTLSRLGDKKTPVAVVASLRERALQSEELGMYWAANKAGYRWYEAPIETQALLIEVFNEVANDRPAVDALKQWLIRQKQTQSWPSTKATAEAVYALLLNGSDWLATAPNTSVRVGGIDLATRADKADIATGYQKTAFAPAEIKPALGTVEITRTGSGPAWGAMYWQHFEPLDKVTAGNPTDSSGLRLKKDLFLQKDSPSGPVLTPVTDKTPLQPGDLLKVRVILTTDRLMEYVHLADSRAAGFEPVAVLSGYKYQNGLGYYEAPRDTGTDFFLSEVPVGTHVFEYALRVSHTGQFAAGVATVQCFYAPEFSAHSAGSRVRVGGK